MAYNTGDITEVTCSHPTLGNFTFQTKKGGDWTYQFGGIKTTDEDDGVTGSGEAMYGMENSRWFIEGAIAWDMVTRDELNSLTLLSASLVEGNWTVNCINGAVHGGTGKPVGDFTGTNKGEIAAKISGGGLLEKIS